MTSTIDSSSTSPTGFVTSSLRYPHHTPSIQQPILTPYSSQPINYPISSISTTKPTQYSHTKEQSSSSSELPQQQEREQQPQDHPPMFNVTIVRHHTYNGDKSTNNISQNGSHRAKVKSNKKYNPTRK